MNAHKIEQKKALTEIERDNREEEKAHEKPDIATLEAGTTHSSLF